MNRYTHVEETENRRTGFWLSLILHVLLLFLFLIPCFKHFNNQDKEELQGVIIALGNPDSETRTDVIKSAVKKSAPPAKQQPKETVSQRAKPTPQSSSPVKVVSQTTVATSEVIAAEYAKKAKENQEKLAEEQRLKQQELERQRLEEEARKAEQEKSEAKSKFSNLFKSGSDENQSSKGVENGKPNAEALSGLSSGSGKVGTGLGSRELIFAPSIQDNTQKTGRVIVNICVEKSGKVISAKFKQKGSTTLDAHLVQLAESSAKKYLFSESTIAEQCGDIIIDFKLK